MRIVDNVGTDRIIDLIRQWCQNGHRIDVVTPTLSLFAFGELMDELSRVEKTRLVLPPDDADLRLLGAGVDRAARNRLQGRWLARRCARWIENGVELHRTDRPAPQGTMVLRDAGATPRQVVSGAFSFDTGGLGIAPSNPFGLIQASDDLDECTRLGAWFDQLWSGLRADIDTRAGVVAALRAVAADRDPLGVYVLILRHLFEGQDDGLDEEQVVKSATGIRKTEVWRRLYKFQRDGVVGAIDKLGRFGGCIIADSVGLGKTFEALAVIKYHELRNDRVLVLCNFRNKKRTPRQGGETRYDRLLHRIIRDGVKTRVLMLSATPVNNRLADLRNQVAFAADHREVAQARREYYGSAETGRFPDRLKPMNVKPDVDLAGRFLPFATSTRRFAPCTWRRSRHCGTCFPTSRTRTTRSTAPVSNSARGSSDNRIVNMAAILLSAGRHRRQEPVAEGAYQSWRGRSEFGRTYLVAGRMRTSASTTCEACSRPSGSRSARGGAIICSAGRASPNVSTCSETAAMRSRIRCGRFAGSY